LDGRPYSTDRSHLQPSSSVERVAHREHRLFLPDGQITFASGIGISNASKIFRLIARPILHAVSNWEAGSALKQKLIEYIKMSGIFPKSGLISCSFFE